MINKKNLYRYVIYYSLLSIVFLVAAFMDTLTSRLANPILLSCIYVVTSIAFVILMSIHSEKKARAVQIFISKDKKDLLCMFIRKRTGRKKVKKDENKTIYYGTDQFEFLLIPIVIEEFDDSLCCNIPQKYDKELRKLLCNT